MLNPSHASGPGRVLPPSGSGAHARRLATHMRRLLIIGIGAGDPDHLTVQAIKALNQARVFFLLDKGEVKDDLVRLRRDIVAQHVREPGYRFVALRDPVRDPTIASYGARVVAWHRERAAMYEAALRDELSEDDCGAFLVWGDPSLYDSTLRIVEQVTERGEVPFTYEVIPGISSIQALAASHKLALNRIGGPVHITTGRKLKEGEARAQDDVVVMLDGECSFKHVADEDDVDIYWGAYLGTEREILRAGKLREVAAEIEQVREAARREHGWVMDTYLLRRRRPR